MSQLHICKLLQIYGFLYYLKIWVRLWSYSLSIILRHILCQKIPHLPGIVSYIARFRLRTSRAADCLGVGANKRNNRLSALQIIFVRSRK